MSTASRRRIRDDILAKVNAMENRLDLDHVAELISEGRDVDWSSAQDGASEEDQRWLRQLRVVSQVSSLSRGVDGPGLSTLLAELGAPVQSDAPAAPERWGSMNLLERIGGGGFGDVYRAWEENLHRQVALKLFRTRPGTLGDQTDRVLNEARLLAKLDHPGLVRVHGAEVQDGRLGMWMELIDGVDLRTRLLERSKLEVDEAVDIATQVALALQAAHEVQVVHQDVKPENVMIRSDGRVVLTDFGAGRLRRSLPGEAPQLAGTPRAMAPELFHGGSPSPATDVYSLGAMLFQMLSGELPVPAGTVTDIMQAHDANSVRRLGDLRRDLDAGLVAIVDRALAPSPDERFATANDLAQSLQTWSAGQRKVASSRNWRTPALVAGFAVAAAVVAILVLPTFRPTVDATVRFQGVRGGELVDVGFGDQVGPSERVGVEITPSDDAWVYVVNVDAANRATVLFPLPFGTLPVNPLDGGEPHWLPGYSNTAPANGSRLGWTFDSTVGVEHFVVIVSKKRLRKFEAAVDVLPSVGLGARPLRESSGQTLAILTRGVSGVAAMPTNEEPATVGVEALLELARGERESRRDVWFHHMRLLNTGAP